MRSSSNGSSMSMPSSGCGDASDSGGLGVAERAPDEPGRGGPHDQMPDDPDEASEKQSALRRPGRRGKTL